MREYTILKFITNCFEHWRIGEFIEDLIICYVPSLLILGAVIWALN